MTPERWMRVREVFEAALDEPPERRSAFVADACAGDAALEAEARALLASAGEAGSFLERGVRLGDTEVSAAGPPPPPSRAIGTTIAGFRILRLLGEGGMGIVYEAQQERPHRLVALKVVRGGISDPHRLRLFEREVEALARLRHPGIAAIYQAGQTDGGEPFFAMELAQGTTLREALGGGSPLAAALAPMASRLALFVKICEAVNYAHQKGVVHRDLKPANILVGPGPESAGGPGDPEVKILDFGLARVNDPDLVASLLTQVGAVQGTFSYMSPEQARGNPDEIDLRTDVYSLGVILYELATGMLPYDVTGRPPHDAIRMICEQPPIAVRRRATADGRTPARPVPRDLETIILKALEKEPSRRYQSALALAEDVERHLRQEPILARAPSTAYQVRMLVRRHRAAVAVLVAVFILTAAFAVAMTVQRNRARAAEEKARSEAARATAIKDFVKGILASGDPRRQGRDARVLDVLEDAAGRVGPGLQGQPEVEASVRDTLSEAFYYLGQFDHAREQAERAIALHERALPSDSLASLKARDNRVAALIGQGQFEEAEKAGRDAVERKTRALGPTHPETLGSMSNLAAVLLGEARFGAAEAILRDLLRRAEGVLPEGDDVHLIALNNLGMALRRQNKFAEAETVLRQLVETSTRVHSESHPDTLSAMTNLVSALSREGKLAEAEELGRKVFAAKTRVLGAEHAETVVSQSTLGQVLCQQKKAEGEQVLRDLIGVAERPTFQSRFPPAVYHARLGTCLAELGRYAEAEREMRPAWDVLAARLGPGDARTREVAGELARLYEGWGKPDRAAAWKAKAAS